MWTSFRCLLQGPMQMCNEGRFSSVILEDYSILSYSKAVARLRPLGDCTPGNELKARQGCYTMRRTRWTFKAGQSPAERPKETKGQKFNRWNHYNQNSPRAVQLNQSVGEIVHQSSLLYATETE